MRLTVPIIRGLAPRDRIYLEPDDECRGLHVRVYPSGKRVWILRYRSSDGTQRYYKIGPAPEIPPSQAREIASKRLGEVADEKDPAADRRRSRQAQTLEEVCEEWLSRVERRCRATDLTNLNRHVYPELGHRKAQSITHEDIARLHTRVSQTSPGAANRTVEMLRAIYNRAAVWGLVSGQNPCVGIEKNRERPRDRWLDWDEITRLAQAIEAYTLEISSSTRDSMSGRLLEVLRDGVSTVQDLATQVGLDGGQVAKLLWSLIQYGRVERVSTGRYRALPVELSIEARLVRGAVELLLHTGCRKSEILTALWPDVDLERGILRLRDSKTGAADIVITGPARQIIERLPRIVGQDPDYLFPGSRAGTMMDFDKHWAKIRQRAGMPDVWVHDLRRSVASLIAAAGEPIQMVQRQMRHASYSTTLLHYVRVGEDPQRAAAERHSARVEAAWRGQEAEVITLPRRS